MKTAYLLYATGLLVAMAAHAQDVDIRYTGTVLRTADGAILRNAKVVSAFRRIWKCPATGLATGACAGWKVDHVLPLACGGADVVHNMQWLPYPTEKDRFERRVYGGNLMSLGCP